LPEIKLEGHRAVIYPLKDGNIRGRNGKIDKSMAIKEIN
jgi:hypothetical protein